MPINENAPCDWHAGLHRTCILGKTGSGKTTRLARIVAESLSKSGNSESEAPGAALQPVSLKALVLVASPQAEDEFKLLLAQEAGLAVDELDAAGVLVTTPRAYALKALANPAAQAFVGRRPRILLPFEENILLEDVKRSGVRPKRLREMLKFFCRSWSELADDDPAWLVSEEELAVHALLKECLAFTGGILADEVSNLALRWLRHDSQAHATMRAESVFVDDYQLLSRASQVLCGMLAQRRLVITGDAMATEPVFENYPYAAGLDRFVQTGPISPMRLNGSGASAAVSTCCEALAHEIERCAAVEGADLEAVPAPTSPDEAKPATGAACIQVFPSPAEEIASVGEKTAELMARQCAANDIFIAVPNRAWAHSLARCLDSHGIACAYKATDRLFRVDTRDLSRCDDARLFTLLCLAADQNDMLAWRSWCAFGDWLAESPGFAALRSLAAARGCNPLALLPDIEPTDLSSAGLDAAQLQSLARITGTFKAGREILCRLEGLKGAQLVEQAVQLLQRSETPTSPKTAWASDSHGPSSGLLGFLRTVADGQDLDAPALVSRVLSSFEDPRFPNNGAAVRIGPLSDMHGQSFDTVFFTGFVNGFIPKHDYFDPTKTELDRMGRMHAQDTRRVYQATGKARRNLFVSAFENIDAAQAEALNLKIERIFLKGGTRTARVAPSELLGAMELSAVEER